MKTASGVILLVIACLALLLTSSNGVNTPLLQFVLTAPPYITVTTILAAMTTLVFLVLIVVRFFSQDWAGVKIRYEERQKKVDHAH